MSSKMNSFVNLLVDSMNNTKSEKSPYDTQAEVIRVENGTAYVRIPGGVKETPIKLTMDAKAGDNVQVRVSGGRAWLTGNATAPPTDDTTAIVARTAANVAKETADIAQETAETAIDDAARAKTAADNAQVSADLAATAAGNAQTSANEAATAAGNAQTSANSAGEAASRAQAAASAAQGDIDEQQEYFWHDSLGAHILSNTDDVVGVRYRTDLKGAGLEIFELDGQNQNSVASFGVDGSVIGRDDSAQLKLTDSSVSITDMDNFEYFRAADLRDSEHNITEYFKGDGNTDTFYIMDTAPEYLVYLKVDGIELQDNVDFNFTGSDEIIFYSAPANGSVIEVKYHVSEAYSEDFKYYNLGLRNPDSKIGKLSVSEGYYTISGVYSHAEGLSTEASGGWCHAEGDSTVAKGGGCHAEGAATVADGSYCHAEGYNTTATESDSHAEGCFTEASGRYSHSQNYGTIACRKSQTAIGEYNTVDNYGDGVWTKGEYVLLVGNGSDENSRSNALTIDWSGNVEAAGDITDGAGNKLANKVDLTSSKPLFKTVTETATVSNIGANSSKNASFAPAAQTGYTRVGIVGWNTANIHVFIATCTGTTLTFANASSSTQTCTNASVIWLFIRSSL